MDDANDPRVYFAAERTLLAWIRTGLTVMGLGFVVARFGLFLQMLRDATNPSASPGSTVIGVSLVVLGALAIAQAARQHAVFCRGLRPDARPTTVPPYWSVGFAGLLSVVGIALAGYILWRT